MTVVVQFKPKEHSPEATRKAIEGEFVRLAEKYGVYEVVTVATYMVATAIEAATAKNTPNATGWAEDLRACLARASKAAGRHQWLANLMASLTHILRPRRVRVSS